MIEHSARALWMIDGEATSQRAARAWLAKLSAEGEAARTAAIDTTDSGAMAGAPERLRALVETTIPEILGEAPQWVGRSRTWELAGQRWPSMTACVTDFVDRYFPGADGAVLYRQFSVLTHPDASAPFAFMREDDDGSTIIAFNIESVEAATHSALWAWERACARLLEYHGWQRDRFDDWRKVLGERTLQRRSK